MSKFSRYAVTGLIAVVTAVAVYRCGSVRVDGPQIIAPATVTATAGDASVSLTWGAVSTAAGYMVYWNDTGGVTTRDSSQQTSTNYATVLGLTNGTKYYFNVASMSPSGDVGSLGKEINATPVPALPSPPGNVTAASAGAGSVTITWDPQDGADYYYIYYGNAAGIKNTDAKVKVTGANTYTFTGLTPGTYYFRVSAVNATGESDLSDEKNVTL